MDFHESSGLSGPLYSMNGIPLARRSASTPISNSDAVESLLLLGEKPVIAMDHQISLPAFKRSSTLPEHSNHGDTGLMVNYYQKMRLRNNEASKRCRLKRRIKQESLEKTRLLLDRQRLILSQRLNRLNKIKLILGEACKEINTKSPGRCNCIAYCKSIREIKDEILEKNDISNSVLVRDSKLLRNTNLEEVLGADLSSDTLRPMRRGPRKHDYDSLLGADLSLGSSIHDTDAWSVETDGASSSGSTRSRSSMSRQEAPEDDGVIILNSRMGGTMVGRMEPREALDLSSCSSKKEMHSLSARAASSETQQLVSLQEENRKLVAERTVLQTQVSKSNLEKDRFTRNLEQLKDKVSTLENTEQIKNKLERETQHLSQELEKYTGIQEQYDNMTEQLNSLNLKIREQTERQEELQTENMKLRVENQKLNRRVESIRNENQSIADIEQEKDGLKQTIGQLRTTITTLQKGQTKQDELELKMMTSTNENTKLQRQLDTLNRKFEEQSLENTEIETENKKMQKTIETLKVTVRRVNQLETENLDLEGKTHKVERENKSLIREIERLKQAVEVKDLSLDNSSAKLAQIERELEKVRQEKDSTELNEAKIQELEASNADLSSQCLADKKALLDLREELVKEKMAADQLVSKLEQVNQQLKVIGDAKEEEHETTEVVVKERVQMLRGENRVSVLQAERDQLSSELARLRVAAVGSEDKEVAWSKQVSGLQEDLVNLSKEKAGLQVENRTLQSQSSSLLDQINNLQAEYSRLEMDLTKATKQEKDREVETTQLLADQTRLQSLHNQLQQDYDRLRDEREELKTNERILRSEISKLRERIAGFTQGQDDILRAKEALDLERETLNMDKKTLSNLRSEHSRLKDDFRSLFTANERMKTEYCNLQTDYKTLKTENNQLKLKNTKLAGQLGDGREQMTILDVENSKVNNRCEVLHQLNLSLEEDRKSLMSQVSLLLYQYHDLLTQTLDDKEHFHEEEREYSDKMNNLRRQKEKLEEKIMEQYKKMDNTTPKKKGIGLTLVKRMKKAGSNMFLNSPGRNRRIEEDTSSLGSGGNESIDSESRSPSEAMLTSGGDLHSGDKLLFRRSLPASMMGIGLDEEEEKEEEDNQSIVSYFSGLGYDQDHIPTRDTGLDRDLFRDNREYDYPEFNTKDDASSVLGLSTRDALTPSRDPLTPSRDLSSTPTSVRKSSETQPRSISRVYLSAGSDVIGGRGSRAGEEPRLTSWKKTGDTDLSLPPLPARRPQTPPPSRPPKPRGSNPPTDDEESKKDSTSESSVWYEYGCV